MTMARLPLWPGRKPADPARSEESDRARVIAAHGIEAVEDDPELVQIVEFAAQLCGVPVALVTVVEEQRQRFLARAGFAERETPRSTSFCGHAMFEAAPLVVPDATKDPRFAENPLVTGEPGIRFYAGAPLVSSEGTPLGALCAIDFEPRPEGLSELQLQGLSVLAEAVMRRLTFERQARAADAHLSRSEQRVRQLAEHLPVYAWAADAAGDIDYANQPFLEFCGTDDLAAIDFATLIHPDNLEEVAAARRLSRETASRWEARAQVMRHDGIYRWMILRAWPVTMGDEPPEAWFGAAVDIDDLHRLSDSRDLLARELSHRIKNIFAVVSGLVAVRARAWPHAKEFADELQATIRALGRAHDYVRPFEGRKGSSLHGLLEDLLQPYRDARGGRVAVNGDDCTIGEKAATPLALIFHELATNSAKYGALGDAAGSVSVDIASSGDVITADWFERGLSPGERDSAREGFGSRLLRMAVEGQLDGKFERRFEADALHVALTLSRAAVEAGD
jgi:PAS domain S-box-containing protein